MAEEIRPYVRAIALKLLGPADRVVTDGKTLRYDKIRLNVEKCSYYDSAHDMGGDINDLVRRTLKLANAEEAETWIAGVKAEEEARWLANKENPPALPENITPQFDHELERAIVGGLILHPGMWADIAEIAFTGDFTFWIHQAIFDAIGDLVGREQKIQAGAIVAAIGGDDGSEVVPGFRLTEYIARIMADTPDGFEKTVSELASNLRKVSLDRERDDEEFSKQAIIDDAREAAKFRLRNFADVQLQISANYLVRGLIPRSGLVVLWGPPKCGKSFWIYDLAMHVATGASYRGRKTVEGPVVYLVLEGEHGYGARVEAYRQRHLKNRTDPVPLYDIVTRVDLVKDHRQLIKDIGAQLPDNPPVMVVIDTLNRSLAGSESSDEDMSAYVKAADAIREAFGCAVIVVHHCGTNGERPRGHTSLTGAADAQLAVRRDDARNVVVKVEYMKDGKEGELILSRLDGVTVGMEPDGTPITSCVIEGLEGTVGDKGFRPNPQERLFLQCLFDALSEHGEPVTSCGIDLPQSIGKVVEYKYVKTFMYERMLTEGDDDERHAAAVRQVLSRCGKVLKAGQVVGSHRPSAKGGKQFIWWTGKPVTSMPSTQRKTFEARTMKEEPELPADIADFTK